MLVFSLIIRFLSQLFLEAPNTIDKCGNVIPISEPILPVFNNYWCTSTVSVILRDFFC